MSTETEAPPFTPLVADVLSAMFENNRQTTTTLIDSLTAQVEDRDAELAAIRDRIHALLDGDYMPTPTAILRALYPTSAVVDRYRPEEVS
jgi:hypothetical protein